MPTHCDSTSPPQASGGGGTLDSGGGLGLLEGPTSDDWTESLALCKLCVGDGGCELTIHCLSLIRKTSTVDPQYHL
jgi:hypothetical protein